MATGKKKKALYSIVVFAFALGGNACGEMSFQGRLMRVSGFERVGMQAASEKQVEQALQWRSVVQSEPHPSDQGQVYVSLTPARGDMPPVVWNVTRNEIASVEAPDMQGGVIGNSTARVTYLGAFHGGLAPASVEYGQEVVPPSGRDKQAVTRAKVFWGYVDSHGRWAVQPRFAEASAFVGEVAVVATSPGDLQLIGRKGDLLPWPHSKPNWVPPDYGVRSVKLERLGRWVWINHAPNYTEMPDGSGAGEPTYLSDGVKLIPLPGVHPAHSVDGELWLLHTAEGTRLWRPSSGFVHLPENLLPWQPISATLFTSPSRTTRSAALYTTDGRLVADDAPIVKVLTPTRFIVCQGGYSTSLFEWAELSRNVGPDLPNHRCGIMDDKGQWWAKPVHQMIDRWGEHQVRLQSEANACMADLREESVPDCTQPSGASAPLLNIDSFPRRYAYQNPDRHVATSYDYLIAYPYIGQLAQVVDAGGFPALIDQAGNLLTPSPKGPLLAEAHLRATIAQSPYRNRMPAGYGLIDRNGTWVIPPVFQFIGRYPDGSLFGCQSGLQYTQNCQHLDTAGNPLPPTTERTLDSMNWVLPASAPAAPPESAVPSDATPHPLAVALNGRWGFQDGQGKWVIEPRFDDAEDFAGDYAPAGMLHAREEAAEDADGSAAGEGKVMLWGLVDMAGRWKVQPQFDDAEAARREVEDFSVVPASAQSAATCCTVPGAEVVTITNDDYVLAKVKNSQGAYLYGYYQPKQGKWAIAPTFAHATPFVGEFAAAKGTLPELPKELRARWVTIGIQPLMQARLFAVKAEQPGAADEKAGRFAVVDDAGNWMIPVRSLF